MINDPRAHPRSLLVTIVLEWIMGEKGGKKYIFSLDSMFTQSFSTIYQPSFLERNVPVRISTKKNSPSAFPKVASHISQRGYIAAAGLLPLGTFMTPSKESFPLLREVDTTVEGEAAFSLVSLSR